MQSSGRNIGNGYISPLEIPATSSTNFIEETEWSSGPTGPIDSWKSPCSEDSWRASTSSVKSESWVQRDTFVKKEVPYIEPNISDEFMRHLKAKRFHTDEIGDRNGYSSNYNSYNKRKKFPSVSRPDKSNNKPQGFQGKIGEATRSIKEEIPEESRIDDFEEKVRKQLEMVKRMENQQKSVSGHAIKNEYEQDEYEEVDESTNEPQDIPSKPVAPVVKTTSSKPSTARVITRDLDFEQIHFYPQKKRKTTPIQSSKPTVPISRITPMRDESWADQYRRKVETTKHQLYGSGDVPSRLPSHPAQSFFFSPMPISSQTPSRFSTATTFNGPVDPINSLNPSTTPMSVPKPVPISARKHVQEALPPPGLVSESYFRNDDSRRTGLLGYTPGQPQKPAMYNGPVGWDGVPLSQKNSASSSNAYSNGATSNSGYAGKVEISQRQTTLELDSDDEDNDTYARLLDMFNKDKHS